MSKHSPKRKRLISRLRTKIREAAIRSGNDLCITHPFRMPEDKNAEWSTFLSPVEVWEGDIHGKVRRLRHASKAYSEEQKLVLLRPEDLGHNILAQLVKVRWEPQKPESALRALAKA